MILVNGLKPAWSIARDRGLAYGDGVFRTLPLRGGRAVLWPRQYAKLASDCAALAIRPPAAEILAHDLATIAARHADGAVRITLTRGSCRARLRACPEHARSHAHRQLERISPAIPRVDPRRGVRVRWCNLRLALQPALAGIKHLNRLENVLARAEWHDPADRRRPAAAISEGHVIGGTMSNLFLLRGGVLTTPALARLRHRRRHARCDSSSARAAKACRCVLRRCLPAGCARGGCVFLVNSLIGVWPVAALDDMTWAASPFAAHARQMD